MKKITNKIVKNGLPFPEFKINKIVFKNHRIWKNACGNELDHLFYQLRTKAFELIFKELYLYLRNPLINALRNTRTNINSAYSVYANIDRTKIKQLFSKRHHDKVKNERLALIDN